MAIHSEYNQQHKFLVTRITGHLTINDIEKHMSEILNSSEHPADVNILYDLSDMQFDNIDIEFEQQLIKLREGINDIRGSAKLALVSNYVLGEPLIKLFTILSKDLNQLVQKFDTIQEAELWLIS